MHQKQIRRFALSMAAAAGLALGSIAIAAPAQACDAAKQCGYQHSNYGGSQYQQKFSNADLSVNTVFNDVFSSLRNNKTVAGCYYTDNNYGGLQFAVSAGGSTSSLSSDYNDRISSLKSC
jgi:hypothetical protein